MVLSISTLVTIVRKKALGDVETRETDKNGKNSKNEIRIQQILHKSPISNTLSPFESNLY